MTKETTPASDPRNTFDNVIAAIDQIETDPARHLSLQIDAQLEEVIRAAKLANKPGKLTVEIKVTPGPERRIVLSGSVKTSIPRPATNSATLYADDDGRVHHQDPAQLVIPSIGGGPRGIAKNGE